MTAKSEHKTESSGIPRAVPNMVCSLHLPPHHPSLKTNKTSFKALEPPFLPASFFTLFFNTIHNRNRRHTGQTDNRSTTKTTDSSASLETPDSTLNATRAPALRPDRVPSMDEAWNSNGTLPAPLLNAALRSVTARDGVAHMYGVDSGKEVVATHRHAIHTTHTSWDATPSRPATGHPRNPAACSTKYAGNRAHCTCACACINF